MKYLYISLICCLSILTSCEDSLTMIPENSTTFENGLDSETELDAALNALANYGRKATLYNSIFPAVIGIQREENTSDYIQKVSMLDPEQVPTQQVGDAYQVVYQANMILEAIDKIELAQGRYDFYKGNALFYKAFCYWQITRRYGDVVLIKDDLVLDPIAKSRMHVAYDYIIKLLIDAEKLLPEYRDCQTWNGNSFGKYIACKGSANALLANACLWQAGTKWFATEEDKKLIDETELLKIAEQACTKVIESPEYHLATSIEEVCTKVMQGNSSESVFEFPYKDLYNEVTSIAVVPAKLLYVTWPVRIDESEYHIYTKEFKMYSHSIKSMYEDDDDRRKEYFYKLDDPEPMMASMYAYQYKYRYASYETYEGTSYQRFRDLNIDKNIFRLTEVFLMRAEIRSKLGKADLAVQDLNKIRSRANASLYNNSEYGGDLQKAIFKEFDKELMFEEKRYYQIIRNGEAYVREYLEGGFKTATIQDFTDGAFWMEYSHVPIQNVEWRENIYWSKRK